MLSRPVVTAALTKPPAEREEKSMSPEEAMPVKPEAAPSVEMSQLVELTATVLDPPPMVTAPVEVPVLMLVVKFEESLRLTLPPEVVTLPTTVSLEPGLVSPIPKLPVLMKELSPAVPAK
ncbi:MAG: hypothetical protein UV37_C0011G0001 [Candidatus Collierbacteria bacterium GW2011_GWA1_42_60]|uniref:Uncharacterized protein n=1 Tax=Candidatus Collierbacteria bacterium GW2011_GWA2_42_17 TaxID=1618378 RepID=A0A0G1B883_9BACT|nr:MAG: hypothetical protein UV06_C0010G0001 [Candidatus Collierbacteria bacterium GW2011_GWA2_42_17]KKS62123.1 MAG: hypothetical protein UV28_C0017G0001 [Candidatus Collierbacteria bacterium GW2011_GWE2_42_48]KKS67111.1 MAG: hypothetical protein UV37_C0011G0001 [Candidatus Collierbacteria bacterium GW2011_GWA1_42_60]